MIRYSKIKVQITIVVIVVGLIFGHGGYCAGSSSNAELCYGNLFALHGQYQQAIIHFDKAIKLNPNLAQAYSHRAAARVELKEYKEALKDCNIAIRLDPKNIHALVLRGLIYKKLGNVSKDRLDMVTANKILPAQQRIKIQPISKNDHPIDFHYDPEAGPQVKLRGLSN